MGAVTLTFLRIPSSLVQKDLPIFNTDFEVFLITSYLLLYLRILFFQFLNKISKFIAHSLERRKFIIICNFDRILAYTWWYVCQVNWANELSGNRVSRDSSWTLPRVSLLSPVRSNDHDCFERVTLFHLSVSLQRWSSNEIVINNKLTSSSCS